jgi:hypothetical protein
MKKFVWVAGLVVLLAFAFPHGFDVPAPSPAPQPVPVPVVPDVPVDATIVRILAPATRADRNRIVGVYSGLHTVLSRDDGVRLNNTEKWAEVQARTLQMAIDTPGKYPGLDVAIENVFKTAVQSDTVDALVVNPVKGDVLAALLKACEIVMASARVQ